MVNFPPFDLFFSQRPKRKERTQELKVKKVSKLRKRRSLTTVPQLLELASKPTLFSECATSWQPSITPSFMSLTSQAEKPTPESPVV